MRHVAHFLSVTRATRAIVVRFVKRLIVAVGARDVGRL